MNSNKTVNHPLSLTLIVRKKTTKQTGLYRNKKIKSNIWNALAVDYYIINAARLSEGNQPCNAWINGWCTDLTKLASTWPLTLLHSECLKLNWVLAILRAMGLTNAQRIQQQHPWNQPYIRTTSRLPLSWLVFRVNVNEVIYRQEFRIDLCQK